MDWFWLKTRSGKAVEAGLHILDTAICFGLVSVAADWELAASGELPYKIDPL